MNRLNILNKAINRINSNPGGSLNWSAYWAQLISATVEDAAPTNFILTFPSAKSLTYADFTISGFPLISSSWAGGVLTLVSSVVAVYGDTPTVQLNKGAGYTHAVTNNVLWTPSQPLSGETPNFWIKAGSRNGRTLIDSVSPGTGDATVLLPYLNNYNGVGYAGILDNGALDIGSSDFTFGGWVKGIETTNTGRSIFGKRNGSVAGSYCVYYGADWYYSALVQTTGGLKITSSTVSAKDGNWHLIIVEIDRTAGMLRFFIDNVQIGTDLALNGTTPALANSQGFYICNGCTTPGTTSKTGHLDTFILNRKLTPTEKTATFGNGLPSNNSIYPSDCKAHWLCAGAEPFITDISGNGYHLTGTGLYNLSHTKFSTTVGTTYFLDNGYTLWSNGFSDVYVPNYANGTERTPTGIDVNFQRMAFHAGSATEHNLANSLIAFTQAGWDRSSATIFSAKSQMSNTYYDSTNATTKKYWHISELNNLYFYSVSNTNYRGKNFVNLFGSSYKLATKSKLSIFSYNTNKVATDYSTLMNYAQDYVYAGTYENDWIYWKYDAQNIVATRGLRVLKFASGSMYLSVDGGVTYPYSIAVAGLGIVKYAYICANGDLAFASTNKFYRSGDNLTTITEIHPLAVGGGAFTPAADGNYSAVGYSPFMDVTLGDPIVWGTYNTIDNTNINVWYTIDNFVTVKSLYLFQTSLPSVTCNHVHNVTKHPDGTYRLHAGDTNNAQIMKFTYNSGNDTWSWITQYTSATGGTSLLYWLSGMGFYDTGKVVCATDGYDYGIHKFAEADWGDVTKIINVFPTQATSVFLFMESDLSIIATTISAVYNENQVIISKDAGATIKGNNLYGADIPIGNTGFYTTRQKNSNGWYFMQINEIGETYETFYLHGIMWVKMK
jgi:hypothetical protein